MSTETSDISSSPGLILRTAREELKLSIDHVAHDLHLRSSVVHSMENEDYDSFSSDVFLKGYFRSYCRLVNLHEERMVELLEAQLRLRKSEIESVALNAKKAEQAKFRKKMVSVFAALALVAGLSVYVLGYLLTDGEKFEASEIMSALKSKAVSEQSIQSDLTKPKPAEQAPESIPQAAEELSSQASGTDEHVKVTEQAQPSPNAAETLKNETLTNVNQDKVVSVSANKEQELKQEHESNQAIAESSADGESTPVHELPAYHNASFEAVFSGDCWFKFTNAEGKTVFAALKRAGNKVNYTGPAPFNMVLGDARQVSIEFNGLPVDLKPHTAKNGRAQLTLNPES